MGKKQDKRLLELVDSLQRKGESKLYALQSSYFIIDDGNAVSFRPMPNNMRSEKDLLLLRLDFGRKLFDILFDDLGNIKYDKNTDSIKLILQADFAKADIVPQAMRLLGRIAEAVVVRKCRENSEINKKWLTCAKKMNKTVDIAISDKFIAIGTGHKYTRDHYSQHYNPGDTQRDVIWIDKDERAALLQGSSQGAGNYAGLQIKASIKGKSYVLPDLKSERYGVPLVYFDLEDDFYKVEAEYREYIYKHDLDVNIPKKFIRGRFIDEKTHEELLKYLELVNALANNKLTLEQLVNHDDILKSLPAKDAIMSTMLEALGIPHEIGVRA